MQVDHVDSSLASRRSLLERVHYRTYVPLNYICLVAGLARDIYERKRDTAISKEKEHAVIPLASQQLAK
jgi:hypothetical protein